MQYGTCGECGFVMFPVLELSPCGHDGVRDIAVLDESGVVYSWTDAGFGTRIRIVMADFLGGQLRVTGPLLTDSDVKIGDEVNLVAGTETPYAFVLAS
jgi:uncharacterized OB-fold protein